MEAGHIVGMAVINAIESLTDWVRMRRGGYTADAHVLARLTHRAFPADCTGACTRKSKEGNGIEFGSHAPCHESRKTRHSKSGGGGI
ncbi:hypothetical protein OKHIL_68000 [Mycolicibacterium mageritense]